MSRRGAVAFAAGLIVFLCAGFWLGAHPSRLPALIRDHLTSEPAALTAEAAELIEGNYFRAAGSDELANSSLQGMVRELRRRHHDRFSEYFSPQGREDFNQEIEGRFSGIGLSVVPIKAGLHVVQVFPGSPAARARIAPGDTIVSVNGESIAGQSSATATEKIKGPEGTSVRIGVRDAQTGAVRRLSLTRAEVALPNVSGRIERAAGHRLGYVRMLSFSEGSAEQLGAAVRRVQRRGAEGVLLDLRGNPGGLLEEAVAAASLFLPAGEVVVSTKSRTQGSSVHKTSGGALPRRPLVVLVDRGTASAAEILTAALADDAKAPVVGTRTYGKGVFQEEKGLANGGALKLTVGEFFTPAGVNLARSHGIHPDIEARDDPRTPRDEAEQRALRVLAGRIGH